mgnify:CR=1 FL=1
MAGLLLAATPMGAALAAAPERRLLTKAEAHYQDTPKGILCCGTCVLFVRPNACKSVVGEVTEDGWCDVFELAD